jgi:hypothetical protein
MVAFLGLVVGEKAFSQAGFEMATENLNESLQNSGFQKTNQTKSKTCDLFWRDASDAKNLKVTAEFQKLGFKLYPPSSSKAKLDRSANDFLLVLEKNASGGGVLKVLQVIEDKTDDGEKALGVKEVAAVNGGNARALREHIEGLPSCQALFQSPQETENVPAKQSH